MLFVKQSGIVRDRFCVEISSFYFSGGYPVPETSSNGRIAVSKTVDKGSNPLVSAHFLIIFFMAQFVIYREIVTAIKTQVKEYYTEKYNPRWSTIGRGKKYSTLTEATTASKYIPQNEGPVYIEKIGE